MKYFAICIILCCFILNFKLYRDYVDENKDPKKNNQTEKNNFKKDKSNSKANNKADLLLVKSEEKTDSIIPDTANRQIEDKLINGLNLNFKRSKCPRDYRGIYLHNYSSRVYKVLDRFVKKAKKYNINTFVMDVQDAVYFRTYMISKKNVKLCVENGIHPVARIVIFPYGLKKYPISKSYLDNRINIALRAIKAGFSEIQYDYIRFEDSKRLSWVKLSTRYRLIEGFLKRSKKIFAKYGVKLSADVFGRITLNKRDQIGQRLEGLDTSVDFICPMVYPSHFSWSRYMMANPYYTVHKSAVLAKKRLKSAKLIMYIQGFIMRVGYSGLSLPTYIAHQIKASVDAGTRGYIIWNAAQRYWPTYKAMEMYYSGKKLPGFRKKAKKNKIKIVMKKKTVYNKSRSNNKKVITSNNKSIFTD